MPRPQQPASAGAEDEPTFIRRHQVHKLSAIVQLLLGAIPERAFFREPASKGPMRPYLQLVQAVRLGDLAAFRTAMEAHAALFTADGNMALVTRLRQIKALQLEYSDAHRYQSESRQG